MSHTLLQQLSELDSELLVALQVDLTEFDEVALAENLQNRAALLQQVIGQGEVSTEQAQDIITRSRQLTHLTEVVKEKLGEQLQIIRKGRRSQQAYDSIKYQE